MSIFLRRATILLLLANRATYHCQNAQEVEYYVNLINQRLKDAGTYKLPTDAREYKASGTPIYFGSYDFVIIGAGAGGSIIANRLSEVKKWKVLVVEAGGFGDNFTDIPYMYYPLVSSKFNWGYKSVPQTGACLGTIHRQCPYPRGKAVGGTSILNGLVYARGYAADYDNWSSLGIRGWSFKDILPYFKNIENYVLRNPSAPYDPEYHGKGGPLNVEYNLNPSLYLEAWLKANQEIGIELVDYNANKLGVSPAQINTINGRRLDDGKAFITPILRQRKNLKLLTQSYVTKIRFDKNKVVQGVVFNHGGLRYFVKAKREVILAAGSISSPQILMLSGIGPRKHLKDLGIAVIQDLQVGTSLRDHPTFFGLNFVTNYSLPVRSWKSYVRMFLNGTGMLTAPGNNAAVGFYESNFTRGRGIADIELMLVPANSTFGEFTKRAMFLTEETYQDVFAHMDVPRSFIVYVISTHSDSVGTLRLKSANPLDYPLIDSKFLTDQNNRDLERLYEGVQLSLKLAQTKALKAINTTLQVGPMRACKHHQFLTENYWKCAIRILSANLFHPIGTCKMGEDPKKGAVVDSTLKVHGIKGLRIGDASVIPMSIAGHPHATVVMIGERLADFIKTELKK